MGEDEAKPFVDGNGAVVGCAGVQEGERAVAAVVGEQAADEGGGIPVASVFGVRADAADFDVSVEGHALAGHGDELALGSDAVITAHFAGADAEESGESDFDEGEHFGGVGAG
jgi:hypothetical protein